MSMMIQSWPRILQTLTPHANIALLHSLPGWSKETSVACRGRTCQFCRRYRGLTASIVVQAILWTPGCSYLLPTPAGCGEKISLTPEPSPDDYLKIYSLELGCWVVGAVTSACPDAGVSARHCPRLGQAEVTAPTELCLNIS